MQLITIFINHMSKNVFRLDGMESPCFESISLVFHSLHKPLQSPVGFTWGKLLGILTAPDRSPDRKAICKVKVVRRDAPLGTLQPTFCHDYSCSHACEPALFYFDVIPALGSCFCRFWPTGTECYVQDATLRNFISHVSYSSFGRCTNCRYPQYEHT